ncbi:TD and POZ domain-containing protein 4-like [Paramacrobiotus metropolitanus]|uniref:TD and POZ domain-containing protein 4-like n=1 Tax=Paramacrobiotus metropolitanus TaxID=2943436 RepID=UPI0024460504|nr:TD and POZ domain-containing protein 4-like [Paramacrobiotus metropolitanus]
MYAPNKEPDTIRVPSVLAPVKNFSDFLNRQMELLHSRNNHHADFVLRSSDGHKFPVHRFQLAAHSPVFAAMLSHDVREKRTSRCDLIDVDKETVEILLDYLYAFNTARINGTNAEKALAMADKYEIMDLCSICEGILIKSLAVENVVRRFIMAHQRGLKILKEVALRLMRQNIDVIGEDSVLQTAIQSEPALLQIIMGCFPK